MLEQSKPVARFLAHEEAAARAREEAAARAAPFAAARVGYRLSRQFTVTRDDQRLGVWVACEWSVGPDVFDVRCFVPDEDDLTQHAAAVARACERLAPASEAARAELLPR